ncbi:MAG: hypothetical protein JST28_24665 [Acidobacteria bacterium]|nr:hypothetical protein [Acidobacteriota bacterium]
MDQFFLLLIAASLIPICIPLLKRWPLSSQYWRSACIAGLGSDLQAVFVVVVARVSLSLSYSIRFAAIGVSSCVLAIILAMKGDDRWRPGVTITSSIGLCIWAILVSLH